MGWRDSISGGLQGGAGGALAGGSVGGPMGALVGGGLGLLGGLFGGSGEDEQAAEIRRRLMAMSEQGLGPASAAGQSDLRGRQVSHLDQLQALSEGRGPSLAGEMLKGAMDRAQASQAASAANATGRGVGAGGAYRAAAGNVGSMQQNAAQQMAQLRAQEQLGALGMLGGAIGGARGQDETLGMFNAGESNDMTRANRLMQLQALSQAYGANPKTGPSMGEQILAGGASMFGAMGGRGRQATGRANDYGTMQQLPGGGYFNGQQIRYPGGV